MADQPRGVRDLIKHPWARVVLELGGLVLFFWLLARLGDVLTPVLIGLVLAYMLDPLVTWMSKRGFSRRVAVTLVFGTGALLLLGGLGVGIPKAWKESRELYQGAVLGDTWEDANADRKWTPDEKLRRDLNGNGVADEPYLRRLSRILVERGIINAPVRDAKEREPGATPADDDDTDVDPVAWVKDQAKGMVAAYRAGDHRVVDKAKSVLGNIGYWLLALLLIPVYGFFFSLNLPLVSRTIMDHVPLRHRDRTLRIFSEINVVVGAFFRGRLIICLILGVIAAAGFGIARVPSWIVLGLLMGVGTAIPLAAGLTLVPACGLLYLSGADTWQYVAVVATYIIVQGLEPVLIAVIMGAGVEMHPVILIVAILAFGTLLGAPGILLAVPLAATARILMREFVYPHMRRMAGLDESTPAPDIVGPARA